MRSSWLTRLRGSNAAKRLAGHSRSRAQRPLLLESLEERTVPALVGINVGAYLGSYSVAGQAYQSGSSTVDLEAGTYAINLTASTSFTFQVDGLGNVSSGNAAAASAVGNQLTFNTRPITIVNGNYAGLYSVTGLPGRVNGQRVTNLLPGLNDYQFSIVEGGAGFRFNVSATGAVTSQNTVAATGGAQRLTLNTGVVSFVPNGYAGGFMITGVDERLIGARNAVVVLGLNNYELWLGPARLGFDIDAAGNAISHNNAAASGATGAGGVRQFVFHPITVTINPGLYRGIYQVDTVSTLTQGGVRNVTLLPGLSNYEIDLALTNASFRFDVDASGLVTPQNAASAVGGNRVLTFNTTTVHVDPGAYTGNYRLSNVDSRNAPGAADFFVVPGVSNYIVTVGAISSFRIDVDNDGFVTSQNTAAASGGAHLLSFNTTQIEIDPGSFAGAYRLDQITGNVFGLREFALLPGLTGYTLVTAGGNGTFSIDTTGDPSPDQIVLTIAGNLVQFTLSPANRPPMLDPLNDQDVNEGDTLAFTVAGSDPDNDPLTYSLDSGPAGAAINPLTGAFTYAPANGPETVEVVVRVSDDRGLFALQSFLINTANLAPGIDSLDVSAAAVNVGENFTVSGAYSDPGVLDTHTMVVFWGDGTQTDLNLLGGAFSADHAYGHDGRYTVTVMITDNDGDSSQSTLTIDVNNPPPVLDPIANQQVDEGGTLAFTVTGSDPDNDGLVYSLESGPAGASIDALTGAFSYAAVNGPFAGTVVVRLTDGDGDSVTQSFDIDVANLAPGIDTLDVSAASVDVGQTLNVSGAFSDPGVLDTHTVQFDWGDGTQSTATPGAGSFSADHAYAHDGRYTITVTVTDSDGASTQATLTIDVNNPPPVLGPIANQLVNEGSTLSFTVSGSDPDNDGLTYSLDSAPAGAMIDALTGAFSFTAVNGPFAGNVVVRLTDGDGDSVTRSFAIDVNNVPPAFLAFAGSAPSVLEGETFGVSGSFSDAGALDSHSALIDWGDGTSSAGSIVNGVVTGAHSFAAAGAYTVTVVLTDNDGGVTTASVQVSVLADGGNEAPIIVDVETNADEIGDVFQGKKVTVTAYFVDPDAADTHKAVINWGDGTTSLGTVNEEGLVTGNHVYAQAGFYTIRVALTDSQGNWDSQETRAVVSGVGVHDGKLYIIGTAGNDKVTIDQIEKGKGRNKVEYIQVKASFLKETFTIERSALTKIKVYLGAGNDKLDVARDVEPLVFANGGSGHDHINGADRVVSGHDHHRHHHHHHGHDHWHHKFDHWKPAKVSHLLSKLSKLFRW